MALFDQTIPLGFGTNLPPVNMKRPVFYDDNSYHLEELSSTVIVRDGLIECFPLTEAQKDTVMTFYSTNRDIAFTFVDPNDGETYSLKFTDEPKERIVPGWSPNRFRVLLYVVGEKVV
jgi:hypothetical protein